MGILSSGFRAKLFLSLWWSVRSWLLSFPPNACRGERCGVWGSIAPSDWVLVVASGAFPLRLPGALFFSSGNLLPRLRRLMVEMAAHQRPGTGSSQFNKRLRPIAWSRRNSRCNCSRSRPRARRSSSSRQGMRTMLNAF